MKIEDRIFSWSLKALKCHNLVYTDTHRHKLLNIDDVELVLVLKHTNPNFASRNKAN